MPMQARRVLAPLSVGAHPLDHVAPKLAHLPSASMAADDPGPDDLRPAGLDVPTRRESWVEITFGAAMVLAALALALAFPGHLAAPQAVVLVLPYAFASRVQFSAGVAYTKPIQIIFVPMLRTGSPVSPRRSSWPAHCS